MNTEAEVTKYHYEHFSATEVIRTAEKPNHSKGVTIVFDAVDDYESGRYLKKLDKIRTSIEGGKNKTFQNTKELLRYLNS